MKKFEYSYKALWTICSITIINETEHWLNEIINDCYEKTLAFEQEFSRFKEDSILSILNKQKKQEVSEEFLSLIYKSREVYRFTHWYFNPLINVRKIWYTHSFDENNFEIWEWDEDLSFDAIKNYGNLLEIGNNMNIDFWSIAKWYVSEKISKYIVLKWYKNNLVNMWWDIYANWFNLEQKKWKIGITSPFWNDKPIDEIEISNASISTSGTYLRNWEISGKKYHHIRNPYSTELEKELVSVTIVNNTWYMSDALATAVMAMWKKKWIDFCNKNGIQFMFVLNTWEIIKN